MLLAGCDPEPAARPVARVGELSLDAAVVEHIAARDGLTEPQARARALDTLRLVAEGRRQHAASGDDPGPLLTERREQHLRRAARARLWLEEHFEPEHGAEAIPDDDPLLVRARTDPRLVHPELFMVCQLVIEPPDLEDIEKKAAITAEPQWREQASAAMAPILERVQRSVPPGDPEACDLFFRQVDMGQEPQDPRLSFNPPKLGGFDLDACLDEPGEDGRCDEPRFAPEWTEVVRAMEPGQFSTPFFTRFGLHLVYLHQHLPPQPAGDPATEAIVRASVLDAWRAKQLDESLQQMGQAKSVRLVGEEALPP